MKITTYLLNIFLGSAILVLPGITQATNAPVTTAATMTACPGTTLDVPVTVTGFTNIMTFTLRLEYDNSVMQFDAANSVPNASLYGVLFASSQISGNNYKIMITWADLTPATLTSGATLITLRFNYTSGTTALVFNNDANGSSDCEYADNTNYPVPTAMNDIPTATYYQNGQVSSIVQGGSVNGGTTIYYGSSTGNLTLSGHLGSVVKWQNRYNGGAYTDISSTSGLTVFSEIPSYTGIWDYRTAVQNLPCTAVVYSAPTTVTVLTPVGTSKTWTGTAGTDWISPTNWSPPGTPVVTDNVIIPAGTPNLPYIFTTTATCNNLQISTGAVVTVNPTKNLKVNGILTIQGP